VIEAVRTQVGTASIREEYFHWRIAHEAILVVKKITIGEWKAIEIVDERAHIILGHPGVVFYPEVLDAAVIVAATKRVREIHNCIFPFATANNVDTFRFNHFREKGGVGPAEKAQNPLPIPCEFGPELAVDVQVKAMESRSYGVCKDIRVEIPNSGKEPPAFS
jgi:hypothetical protein